MTPWELIAYNLELAPIHFLSLTFLFVFIFSGSATDFTKYLLGKVKEND